MTDFPTSASPHGPAGPAGGPPDASVAYTVDDGLATITLQRPDARNALDTVTKQALKAAVDEAAGDEAVRAVLLTGSGRAFCVGQDLNEHARLLADAPLDQVWSTIEAHYAPLATTLATMPKPVVAGVNGIAAGAGAALAFACDLRVLSDQAGFNLAFAGIGLSCDTGTSWTLPRLVGHARAVDLLYRPRTVDAAEAERIGLATVVVPHADLAVESTALARRLAEGPTLAYAGIRRSLAHAAGRDLPEALTFEAGQMARTGGSQDHRDAVAAFLARRPPVFTGR